jgi:hypothetical protein
LEKKKKKALEVEDGLSGKRKRGVNGEKGD